MFSSLKKQGVENLKKLVKTFGLFLICLKELIITLPYFYRSFLTFQVLTNQVIVDCHVCNIEFVVAGCIFHSGRESVVSTGYFHITLFTLALHCHQFDGWKCKKTHDFKLFSRCLCHCGQPGEYILNPSDTGLSSHTMKQGNRPLQVICRQNIILRFYYFSSPSLDSPVLPTFLSTLDQWQDSPGVGWSLRILLCSCHGGFRQT